MPRIKKNIIITTLMRSIIKDITNKLDLKNYGKYEIK